MAKTLIGYPGIQADKLKIIFLTLEKLLRNLPRLGGYTQRVRPGAHPVLYQQDMVGNRHEHRKTSFKYCNTRFIKEHKPSNHIRARIKSHVYTTE